MRTRIGSALDSQWLWITARVLVAIVFLSSGLAKLIGLPGSQGQMPSVGLQPEWLLNISTAAVLIGGAVLIILDKALWLGTAALGAFLLLTHLIVHCLQTPEASQVTQAIYEGLEHISLIGGLLATAIASRHRRRLHMALELYCGVSKR